jgi:molybdopterin biosynthesis enzyme MoaB
VPGFGEVMRMKSLEITPKAMLSRAIAGIRGKTLIINLPGSPKAAIENLEYILPAIPHGIEILREMLEIVEVLLRIKMLIIYFSIKLKNIFYPLHI